MRAVPPPGWKFLDEGNWVQGHDYESLMDAIIDDRAKNQRPIGDPPKEFQAWITKQWPHFASSASIPFGHPGPKPDDNPRLRERVTAWAANRYSMRASGHTELQDRETAEARATICAECPSKEDYSKNCPPCTKELERRLFLLRGGQGVSSKPLCCSVAGHDNATAAYLPNKMLLHRNRFKEDLPPNCWMLKLDE